MEMKENNNELVRQVAEQKYEFGFTTDVHTEIIEKGLNEDIVRLISKKKGEPEWMLDFRLKAFRYWQQQTEPRWGHVHVPPIDYQAISYYADPILRPSGPSRSRSSGAGRTRTITAPPRAAVNGSSSRSCPSAGACATAIWNSMCAPPASSTQGSFRNRR